MILWSLCFSSCSLKVEMELKRKCDGERKEERKRKKSDSKKNV